MEPAPIRTPKQNSKQSSMKRRIVIVGGGFAGLFSARAIARLLRRTGLQEEFSLELISELNYFVFQPLLPEVAAGTINAQDAVSPLRQLLPGVRVRQAKVVSVDPHNKAITLIQGLKRKLQIVEYDELVIASGQEAQAEIVPGIANHGLTLKSLTDAHRLRNHVIECMELADVTQFAEIKRRALTFVVAGGGFSGVETVGELMEMIHRVRRFYPNIHAEEIKTILIQRGDRLLPEMNPALGKYAARQLEKRGVEVWLNADLKSVSRFSVTVDADKRVDTHTLVTTIGNGVSQFVAALPVKLNRGKIPVDATLRVESLDHVWALGDVAAIPLTDASAEPGRSEQGTDHTRYAPPTAQFARQEAKCLAQNLVAAIQSRTLSPFSYASKGSLASLGAYTGVAEFAGVRFTGILAWLMWRGIYIGLLPGFSARLRVALNWLFDYFMPRTIVCMAGTDGPATKLLHFSPGDIVHEVDEVLEGFYVVVSGAFERTIPGSVNVAESVRVFRDGDSWGERCLADHRLTIGRVKALEEGVLMLVPALDLQRMREGFAPFDGLLRDLHA